MACFVCGFLMIRPTNLCVLVPNRRSSRDLRLGMWFVCFDCVRRDRWSFLTWDDFGSFCKRGFLVV